MTLRERCDNIAESSGFRCPNAAESGRCDACPVCDKRKRLADAIEAEAIAFAEEAVKTFALGVKRATGRNARAIYKLLGSMSRIVLDATEAAIEAAGKGTT